MQLVLQFERLNLILISIINFEGDTMLYSGFYWNRGSVVVTDYWNLGVSVVD